MRKNGAVRGPWALLVTLLGLAVPFQPSGAQEAPSRDALLGAARTMMEDARYCGLVTFDASGEARARTMDPFLPEADMTIWLGTHRESRKVQEIRSDPRVTLYYQAPGGTGYVTVFGKASIIDDPAEEASRWKEEWAAFYLDPAADYLLIRVTPERLEIIDYLNGIVGDPATWVPPSVDFTGGLPKE